MRRTVRLAPDAVRDLARLPAHAEVKSLALAQRVRDCLEAALASLDEFAERGRPGPDADLRELVAPFGRAAYILQYRVDADSVLVLRIVHSREDR